MKSNDINIVTDEKNLSDYLKNQKCPICQNRVEQSPYLESIFSDDLQTLWVANLITHYRHNHITSWNKCWGYKGSYYRQNWFGDYEDEKIKVNERAKRQLIRKGHKIFLYNGVTVETFKKLQNSTAATLSVANKFLKQEK